MSTQAQINANRQNAQLSSGPKSEAGKAAVRLNAVKTALTGRTILLPTDDVAEYEKLGKTFVDLHKPVGAAEEYIVQSIIDTEWRLQRIPNLEAGLYGLGLREQGEAAEFLPKEAVDAQTFLKYEKQIKNLGLQESRLLRMQKNNLKMLAQLQTTRKEQEEQAKQAQQQPSTPAATPAPEPAEKTVPASAVALFNEAKQAAAANSSIDTSAIGFDFANARKAVA